MLSSEFGALTHQLRRDRKRRARRKHDPRHRVAPGVVVFGDDALAVTQDLGLVFDRFVGGEPAARSPDGHRAARGVKADAHLLRDVDLVVDARAVRPDVAVVGGGRAAGEQQFGECDRRAAAYAAGRQPRPDRIVGKEPRKERRILRRRQVSRQRLVEVMVGADEPGQDDHPTRLDDLVGVLR